MVAGNVSERKQSVLAAAQRWIDATKQRDGEALERLLAEGCTYVHAGSGNSDSRERWLEVVTTGSRQYQIFDIDDLDIQLFPGTAVMTGRVHHVILRRTGETVDQTASFLAVWIEAGDDWQLAAWQATNLTGGHRGTGSWRG